MGYFEWVARRFFFVSRSALASPNIHRLRSASAYILLVILSSVQLANAYRNTYNQGISYAAFIGSLLTLFKNLTFAEDKASSFEDSMRGLDSLGDGGKRDIHGFRHLGLLSSIIKIPIRLERISTYALALKALDLLFTDFESTPYVFKRLLQFSLLVPCFVLWVVTISLNIVGIFLLPLSFLLLLIDILSIPFVETILVAFAENLPWIPELRGVLWGYGSLSLALLAILSAFGRDYLAWVAWLRDRRAFRILEDGEANEVHPLQALQLIRSVPVSHETALAAAIDLAETHTLHPSNSAVHFSYAVVGDVHPHICYLGIQFVTPKYPNSVFRLVKADSRIDGSPPRHVCPDTEFQMWGPGANSLHLSSSSG